MLGIIIDNHIPSTLPFLVGRTIFEVDEATVLCVVVVAVVVVIVVVVFVVVGCGDCKFFIYNWVD